MRRCCRCPLTSFVRRARETAALRDLIRRPETRLLTLTGPGGVGKTRLAIAAAATADGFADGARFVALASLKDPDLVAATLVHALGIREAGDEPLVARLIAFLRERELLLVLDNFEQVLAAAPLLTELLSACPSLTILVTSRSLLGVSGERAYPAPPLTLPAAPGPGAPAPGLDAVAAADAVRLFVDRAQAVRPDFVVTDANAAAVAAICHRLDGLPLAIELAASRVRHLPPPALLARLEQRLPLLTGGPRDQPARLRVMRGAVAWSYDLLSPAEEAIFRRLAVFVGGFTLEGGAAVIAMVDSGPAGSLEGIASLVDQSLLRLEEGSDGEPRFAMLETVREYALERLEASCEGDETRARHAAFFVALAEQAAASFHSPTEAAWLDRLAAEQGNLRTALMWLDERGEARPLLRLAVALAWFWFARGQLGEGREWLARAAERAPGASGPRALALIDASNMTLALGDEAAAEALVQRGLTMAEAAGDANAAARALLALGELAAQRRSLDRGEALMVEALGRWRALGDQAWIAGALKSLGDVARAQGRAERATERYMEAAEAARAIGYAAAGQWCEDGLGLLALDRGDRAAAAAHFAEALRLAPYRSIPFHGAESLISVAALAAASRRPEAATRLLGAAMATDGLGPGHWPFLDSRAAAAEAAARLALDAAVFSTAWGAGRALGLEAALAEARALAEEIAAAPAPVAPRRSGPHSLSPREREVLRLIVDGRTDREIAAELSLSYRTVTSYVASVLTKLDAPCRAAAAVSAVRHGLA